MNINMFLDNGILGLTILTEMLRWTVVIQLTSPLSINRLLPKLLCFHTTSVFNSLFSLVFPFLSIL